MLLPLDQRDELASVADRIQIGSRMLGDETGGGHRGYREREDCHSNQNRVSETVYSLH
jgi:hypothetical protein